MWQIYGEKETCGTKGGLVSGWKQSIIRQPTDTTTLIPFLKDAEQHLKFKYKNITADAGYESEENYLFLEANNQIAFIKPANYEISKNKEIQE